MFFCEWRRAYPRMQGAIHGKTAQKNNADCLEFFQLSTRRPVRGNTSQRTGRPFSTMTISNGEALRRSQDRLGKIIVNFIEFHIKCSNEDIFVLHLANQDFRGYVRSGRRVGEVSQTRYACA